MLPSRAVLLWIAFLTFLSGQTLLGEPLQPPAPIRTDHYGDPLPQGVRFRLGTVRLRHDDDVTALAWLPNGRTLASAGWDGTVHLWQIPGGKPLAKWDELGGAVFSPDGRSLACGDGNGKFSPNVDRFIRIIDVASGKEHCCFRVPKNGGTLDNLTPGCPLGFFSPYGKILAVREAEGVRLYDVDTGTELRFLKVKLVDLGRPVAFEPDSRALLVASNAELLHWTIGTGMTEKIQQKEDETAFAFAFSPDGQLLASVAVNKRYHDTVTLRSWQAGRELRRLDVKDHNPSVLAFSADGKILATGGWGDIVLWDPATGERLRRFKGAFDIICALAFSPDGSLLAAAGRNHAVTVWEVHERKSPRPLTGVGHMLEFVGLAADGQTLLTRSAEGALTVWDVHDGHRTRTLVDEADSIDRFLFGPEANRKRSLLRQEMQKRGQRPGFPKDRFSYPSCSAFSPDNTLFAIGNNQDSKILLLHKTDEGIVDRSLVDYAPVQEAVKRGFDLAVDQLTFSPDGRILAATYSDDRLILWDLDADRPRHILRFTRHGEPYRSLQFSADGRLLALSDRHVLLVVEMASGQAFWKRPLGEHWIDSFAFSPDNRTLAIGDAGSQAVIHLWDLATNKEFHTLHGHRYSIWSLAFSTGGTFLLSGSGDKSILCWDVAAILRRRVSNKQIASDKLRDLWNDLASKDAERGQRAVGELIQASDAALPFLEESLPPVTLSQMARIASWIADLDHAEFVRRDKAATEPEKIGVLAAPALRKVLVEKPTLEMRRRIDALLEALDARPFSPQELRLIRAVQVLETIGTPQAQHILERLSGGAPEAQRTEEAKSALQRLKRRHAKS